MSNVEENPLSGWSKEERYNLLQALKQFGSYDLLKINKIVVTKTLGEIKAALDHYKEKLKQETSNITKKKQKKPAVNSSTVPLDKWTKVLLENLDFKELQTETATALRIIAEYEELPNSECTAKVDFRKVYFMLANALEGKGLSTDDKLVNLVIKYCLVESALTSKQFIRYSTFKMILDNINVLEKEVAVFPRVTDNCELASIRHLLVQSPYNPLNILEKYLKPTTVQTDFEMTAENS